MLSPYISFYLLLYLPLYLPLPPSIPPLTPCDDAAGERCRESLALGGRVIVAESRQNPACRKAFSEALNLGMNHGEEDDQRLMRLRPVEQVRNSLGEGDAEAVAVGGDAEAMMWLLDTTSGGERP